MKFHTVCVCLFKRVMNTCVYLSEQNRNPHEYGELTWVLDGSLWLSLSVVLSDDVSSQSCRPALIAK